MKFNLVDGLPKIKFIQHEICDACARSLQTRSTFKHKYVISTSKLFDLVHMDLFRPTRTLSLNGKRFGLVIVDDYSRFSWVFFIFHKNEAFDKFLLFFRRVQIAHGVKVVAIQIDHGGEFEKNSFDEFCDEQDIKHQYSSPRTPDQNGVVEKKIGYLLRWQERCW